MVVDATGAAALGVPVIEFKVTTGADKNLRLEHASPRTLIGTAEGTHLRLSDPTVSAMHCEFFFDAHGLRVRDLGSKNGVLVGGLRVFDAAIEHGASITLGRTVLKVKISGKQVQTPLAADDGLEGLVGSSLAMRVLYGQIRRAAPSQANVLISGAVGTGKELAAEALIRLSDRKAGPVVVVDCRAIQEGLAESEFFGHELGAFTGASRTRKGLFERAHTGTLILDEVGELSPSSQARLLGVLQRGSFRRVGGDAEMTIDVRVVSLTAHDLPRLTNQNTFRADLYYRLAGLELRVPALEERREDIPLLLSHFIDQRQPRPNLSAADIKHLCSREYAGNVRELINTIERAALEVEVQRPLVAPGRDISLEIPYAQQRLQVIEGFERAYVVALLKSTDGNVSAAARKGGVNRVHLHQLINRLGLHGLV